MSGVGKAGSLAPAQLPVRGDVFPKNPLPILLPWLETPDEIVNFKFQIPEFRCCRRKEEGGVTRRVASVVVEYRQLPATCVSHSSLYCKSETSSNPAV